MSRFAIYETNALPLGKATSTIDVGAFGETEAVHSIAIFTDTVTLQFGAAYELGAGTQDFAENAVADAWVEYSYTYNPDERLIALKAARDELAVSQAAYIVESETTSSQTPDGSTASFVQEYIDVRDAYVAMYYQAVANGLDPQGFLELEDFIAENGTPESFASGTYTRSLFRGAPATSEFSGLQIANFALMAPSGFSPDLSEDPIIATNSRFYTFDGAFIPINSDFWTVGDMATVHIEFDASPLAEFLEEGHVLEGGKTPSNSVLVVVEHGADWSTLLQTDVGGVNPAELEGPIRVLNTFSGYVAPVIPEISDFVDQVVINLPNIEASGGTFTRDDNGYLDSYTSSEYLFDNDATGDSPTSITGWMNINAAATVDIQGDDLDSYYDTVRATNTSGLFALLKAGADKLGLSALSSLFNRTQDAADLAVSIATNLVDPLMRAVDSIDSFDPEEMNMRIDDIRDGISAVITEHIPAVGYLFDAFTFGGRHSAYSYQMSFESNAIPQGDSHSNRIVFGAADALYDAEAGDDYLYGGVGADTLLGGTGDDVVSGGDNGDVLTGGAGNDWLYGDDGDDTLTGTADRDFIEGGAGEDKIVLGGDTYHSTGLVAFNISSDTQVGTQVRASLNGLVRIEAVSDGGAGADVIQLSEEGDAFFLHDAYSGIHASVALVQDYIGNESAARFSDIEEIWGMGGDDIIDLTSPNYSLYGLYLYVDGGEGNDQIWGSDGDEYINGGDGDDTIFGGTGLDFLDGGFGADVFEFTRTSTDATVLNLDVYEGDMLRFYDTGGAVFDPSSVALIAGGMQISFTDTATGTSHDLKVALDSYFQDYDITLPELRGALDFV
jgi:Ca2+-binding RTX toxin-like protein